MSARSWTRTGVLVGLAAIAAACQMQRPIARGMPPGASTVCVFGIPRVRAYVSDTRDGIDVTFSVVGDGAALRRRAHEALVGEYPLKPETEAIVRRVNARIRDEAGGMTIDVVPKNPEELESVRAAVRRRIDEVTSDDCR